MPVLVAMCVLVAAAAVAGVIFLLQLLADDPLTTSRSGEVTTDPRSGLSVGHKVSSINGIDVPLPEGFRLEYEAYYPHEDVGILITTHEEAAHRAQVYTFLRPDASASAEMACAEYNNSLASELSGPLDVQEPVAVEASGELTVAKCSITGENQDLGEFHYEYRAYRFPDGRTILQQTRVPRLALEANADLHETYRRYFTCVINETYDVGLTECA